LADADILHEAFLWLGLKSRICSGRVYCVAVDLPMQEIVPWLDFGSSLIASMTIWDRLISKLGDETPYLLQDNGKWQMSPDKSYPSRTEAICRFAMELYHEHRKTTKCPL
jgi:hypothetical protein